MKTAQLFILLIGLLPSLVFSQDNAAFLSRRGDWSGSGGNGTSAIFYSLSEMIYRGISMGDLELKDDNNKIISGEDFRKSIDSIRKTGKIVADNSKIKCNQWGDKEGNPATARYIPSKNEIQVNVKCFTNEIKTNAAAALMTVTHEFLRVYNHQVAGVAVDNKYELTAKAYATGQFHDIANTAQNIKVFQDTVINGIIDDEVQRLIAIKMEEKSVEEIEQYLMDPVTRWKLAKVNERLTLLKNKFDTSYDLAMSRFDRQLVDARNLDTLLNKQRKSQFKALAAASRSMGDMLENMGSMIGMLSNPLRPSKNLIAQTRGMADIIDANSELEFSAEEQRVLGKKLAFVANVIANMKKQLDSYSEATIKLEKLEDKLLFGDL
jgi:hypothetical protein